MSNIKMSSAQKTKKMITLALFCAIAFSVSFIFRIPVGFRSFDAKDAILTICGLYFGPFSALASSLVVSICESLYSGTGIWGWIMDFASTALFSCTAALIYKFRRNMFGAILGIVTAAVLTTSLMMPINMLVVPMYVPNMTASDVAHQIPTVLFPFNAAKAIFNAALVLFWYKPLSSTLKAAKIIKGRDGDADEKTPVKWQMLVSLGLATLLLLIAIIVIYAIGGEFSFFDFGK